MEGLAVDQLRGEDTNQSFRHLNPGVGKDPSKSRGLRYWHQCEPQQLRQSTFNLSFHSGWRVEPSAGSIGVQLHSKQRRGIKASSDYRDPVDPRQEKPTAPCWLLPTRQLLGSNASRQLAPGGAQNNPDSWSNRVPSTGLGVKTPGTPSWLGQ